MTSGLARITNIKVNEDYTIKFTFDDGCEKLIDIKPFIKDDPLTNPLSDPGYFNSVKIYENGRGIYWPNSYDFCPDFLRYYAEELVEA